MADVLKPDGSVQDASESRILDGHFRVLPGVISLKMVMILAGMDPHAPTAARFENALRPGDLPSYQGDPGEARLWTPSGKIVTALPVPGKDLQQFELPRDYSYINSDQNTLNSHLLQSGVFRLVSGSTELLDGGSFIGHYHIPENHPFLEEGMLPFPFMEEVANQVIVLAYSKTSNPNGVGNGKTILLKSSHIALVDSERNPEMEGGSIITVVGKARPDPQSPKRGEIAEYTVFGEDTKPLFNGKITGTTMKTAILL